MPLMTRGKQQKRKKKSSRCRSNSTLILFHQGSKGQSLRRIHCSSLASRMPQLTPILKIIRTKATRNQTQTKISSSLSCTKSTQTTMFCTKGLVHASRTKIQPEESQNSYRASQAVLLSRGLSPPCLRVASSKGWLINFKLERFMKI